MSGSYERPNHRQSILRHRRQSRRGVILVVVAVVVLLISLAAIGFLMLMQTENKAALARGDQMQAESVGASGAEYLAAILEAPWSERGYQADMQDVPDLLGGILVDGREDDDESARKGRFSVLVPEYSQEASRSWRFGYVNESTKINLVQLVRWDRRRPGLGRSALMNLPNMEESIADAILDWIDSDSDTRDLGAEAEYYMGLNPPQRPRNGAPASLEELLLVRGVTREMLLGLDLNANHQIDSWESDMAQEQANMGVDGQVPWSCFLTVRSGERDESYDGQPRIPLNQTDLGKLHLQLGSALEPGWANFIVAYRQYGPLRGQPQGPEEEAANLTIDLTQPAKVRIRSPLDLIGIRVGIPEPGDEKKQTIVASPFTTDPALMRDYLPKLLDVVTAGEGGPIFGRININLAPREVLLGLPEFDVPLVERVLAARTMVPRDDPARRHATWLLAEEIVDLSLMRSLEPYVTVGGDVGRAQVIAYFDRQSPLMRFETVVDATEIPARRVYYKDLRRLGRGSLEDVMNVTITP